MKTVQTWRESSSGRVYIARLIFARKHVVLAPRHRIIIIAHSPRTCTTPHITPRIFLHRSQALLQLALHVPSKTFAFAQSGGGDVNRRRVQTLRRSWVLKHMVKRARRWTLQATKARRTAVFKEGSRLAAHPS